MRRYRCDLCDWRGLPHAYIEGIVNTVYYAEALHHVAEEHYERFGRWKGLVLWLDMVKQFLV